MKQVFVGDLIGGTDEEPVFRTFKVTGLTPRIGEFIARPDGSIHEVERILYTVDDAGEVVGVLLGGAMTTPPDDVPLEAWERQKPPA